MRDWTDFRRRVADSGLLSEEKAYVISGLSKLEQIVGRDWLDKHPKHPMLKWTRPGSMPAMWFDIAQIGKQMDTIKSIIGFSELKDRILRRRDYLPTRAELWTAYKLARASVSFQLYPWTGKKPDFKVKNGNIIYGEATSLGISKDQNRVQKEARLLEKRGEDWRIRKLSFKVNPVQRITNKVYGKMTRQLPRTTPCFIVIRAHGPTFLTNDLNSQASEMVHDLLPELRDYPNLVLLVVSGSLLGDHSLYEETIERQKNYVLCKGISAMVFQELSLCITPHDPIDKTTVAGKLVEAFLQHKTP